MARVEQNQKPSNEVKPEGLPTFTKPIKVKMIETKQGTFNGFTVIPFYAGREYELTPSLAREFHGYYEIVEEKKNAGAAPDNKMANAPQGNK